MEILSKEMLNDITIGIEIEFTGITRETAAKSIAKYFNTDFYHQPRQSGTHYDDRLIPDSSGRIWLIVFDNSLRGQRRLRTGEIINIYPEDIAKTRKCELVTPVLVYDDINTLADIMKTLVRKGAFVNDTCGIHIHVDGHRFSVASLKNLVNIMSSHENLLYKALKVPEYREENYCQKLATSFVALFNTENISSLDEAGALWYGEDLETYKTSIKRHYHASRYVHTNLHSFFKGYGTIEFRCFNSTFDFEVLKAYVEFCIAVVYQALNSKRTYFKKNDTNNDKFHMRNWLRKLKLNGDDFKTCRQIFLKNLTGNSQFR